MGQDSWPIWSFFEEDRLAVHYACRWNAVRVLWFGNSNIVVVGVTDNHDKPSNCWINDFKLDFVDLFISIQ